jgi:hypothetical protein
MKENIKYVIIIAGIALVVEVFYFFYKQNFSGDTELISMPSVDYWEVFEQITMERKYLADAGAHYRVPVFTQELIDLSGKEVTLSGYFLPYSRVDSVIIISRYPNASCFYCGMAGIESVAMIELKTKSPFYRTDQRLLVKGNLALNNSDVNKLAFIIEEAIIEEM